MEAVQAEAAAEASDKNIQLMVCPDLSSGITAKQNKPILQNTGFSQPQHQYINSKGELLWDY